MLHIVFEGAEGKSESTLVLSLLNIYNIKSQNYYARGNKYINTRLRKEVRANIKDWDRLLIVFDAVSSKDFNPMIIIRTINEIIKNSNIEVYYTSYYCFEEVFLSLPCIVELIADKTVRDFYNNIRNCIELRDRKKGDYSIKYTKELEEIFKSSYHSGLNREQVANILISHGFKEYIRASFCVTKRAIGHCWLDNCERRMSCNQQCAYKNESVEADPVNALVQDVAELKLKYILNNAVGLEGIQRLINDELGVEELNVSKSSKIKEDFTHEFTDKELVPLP